MASTATLPPGPRDSRLSQLYAWLFRPCAFMEAAAARFGDVFTVRATALGTFVFVAAPDDIRSVFTADPDVLRSGEANRALTPLLGPSSLITLDGAAHMRQRRLLLPPFHGERMRTYTDAMRRATVAEVDRWPVGRAFPLFPRMQAITFDVILETVFGGDAEASKRRLGRALLPVVERTAGSRVAIALPGLVGLLGRRVLAWAARRVTASADRALAREIAERRADDEGGEREDVLSLLLRARHEDGAPMTDGELRDELMTLLIAGHDTTATALAWTFQLLLDHPGALAEAQAEIDAAGISPDGPDADDVKRLPYLEATIQEVLRLRPIIPVVVRRVCAPFTIGGHTIPPGANLAPCIYLAHRRSETYPDPERFRPERFLDRKKIDPYTWLPFGGGTRRCIGIWFALFEMKVVLATVLARLRLARPAGTLSRPVRRGVTFAPSDGTAVVLVERLRSAPVDAPAARPEGRSDTAESRPHAESSTDSVPGEAPT